MLVHAGGPAAAPSSPEQLPAWHAWPSVSTGFTARIVLLMSLPCIVRSMMPSSASTWTPMTVPSLCTPTTSAPSSSWTFARCVKRS